MCTDSMLQLEALKLLQEWSIWLITLCTGFLWLVATSLKNNVNKKIAAYARYCVLFIILTMGCAVILVGAIPAQVQHITGVIEERPVFFEITTARGIYSSCYLDWIEFWVLVSLQRLFFLVALILGGRIMWLRTKRLSNMNSTHEAKP